MSKSTLFISCVLTLLSATQAQQDYFYLRGVQSGKCITIHFSSNANGAGIEIFDCILGAKNQFWAITAADVNGNTLNSGFNIVVESNGKCLTVLNARTDQGAPLNQWDCVPGGQGNQIWEIVPGQNGYFQIRNPASNRCVTVLNASTAAYAQLILWDCIDGPNQQWYQNQPCL